MFRNEITGKRIFEIGELHCSYPFLYYKMVEAAMRILRLQLINYILLHYFLRDVFDFLEIFFTGSSGFNSDARAAAKRAIGTRNGEQLT